MMRTIVVFLITLMAIASGEAGEKLTPMIVELPRPNSLAFSFKQAEAFRFLILSNAPTPKLEGWKDPYLGFCIHIHKDDSITVYGDLEGFLDPKKAPKKRSVAEIKKMADAIPLAGNPAGILITSDLPLKDSKVIHELLNVLFRPSIQLFYAWRSEPEGAANGHQPTRSETNSTPAAAGSRR